MSASAARDNSYSNCSLQLRKEDLPGEFVGTRFLCGVAFLDDEWRQRPAMSLKPHLQRRSPPEEGSPPPDGDSATSNSYRSRKERANAKT